MNTTKPTTPPQTTKLTERYLSAVGHFLPNREVRAEVQRELAERIADTVDHRLASGEATTPEDAERSALEELGHPRRVAAEYSDSPLHLIGPDYYVAWQHLMLILVPLVAGIVWLAAVFSMFFNDDSVWHGVLNAYTALFLAAAIVAVIITGVFAILERRDPKTGKELNLTTSWEIGDLRESPAPISRWEGAIEAAVLTVVGAAVMLANQIPMLRIDGAWNHVPLFVPETWAWLRWVLLAVVGTQFVVMTYLIVRRRRSIPGSVTSVAASFVGAVAIAGVAIPGNLINPDFLTAAGWTGGPAFFATGGAGTFIIGFLAASGVIGEAVGEVVTTRGTVRKT